MSGVEQQRQMQGRVWRRPVLPTPSNGTLQPNLKIDNDDEYNLNSFYTDVFDSI